MKTKTTFLVGLLAAFLLFPTGKALAQCTPTSGNTQTLFPDEHFCIDVTEKTYTAETNFVSYGIFNTPSSLNNWVECNATIPSLVNSDRSVFLWVKRSGNPGSADALVAINNSGTGNITQLNIHTSGVIRIYSDAGTLDGTTNVCDGNWHHVGYTYNATTNTVTIYVDGVAENSATVSMPVSATSDRLSLGQEFDGASASNYFNGYMTEISIWNKVLATDDVTALTGTTPNTTDANLVAYYTMEHLCTTPENQITDYSGNNFHGTANEATGTMSMDVVEEIAGYNAIANYSFEWFKDAGSLGSGTTLTATELGSYQFVVTGQHFTATNNWIISRNTPVAADNIANEEFCAGPSRNYTAQDIDYVATADFNSANSNWIQANTIVDDLFESSYSFFVWFKRSSVPTAKEVILGINSSSNDNRAILQVEESTGILFLNDQIDAPTNSNTLSTGVNVCDGQWHLIGYTYDYTDKTTKVYVDGVEEATNATTKFVEATSDRISLGQEYDSGGETDFLTASLSEVSFWNTVLTSAQVGELLTGIPTANTANANLIAYYPMFSACGGDNLTVEDESGNNNFGTASHNNIVNNTTLSQITNYNSTPNFSYNWLKDGSSIGTTNALNLASPTSGNYSLTYTRNHFQIKDDWTLTVNPMPSISAQPTDQSDVLGGAVTFDITATNTDTYQWRKAGGDWATTAAGQNGFPASNDVVAIYVDGTKIYAGTWDAGLAFSDDNGSTWSTLASSGVNGFAASNKVRSVAADGSLVVAGTGAGISVSTDGGASWTTTAFGANGFGSGTVVRSVFIDGTTIYASIWGGGISFSTDNGASWTTRTDADGLINNAVSSVFVAGGKIYAGLNGGVSISDDNGLTWTNTIGGENGFSANTSDVTVAVVGSYVYASTYGGGINISSNGGASWTNITSGTNGFTAHNAVREIWAEGSYVYVGTNSGFAMSSDNGVNWQTTLAGENNFPETDNHYAVFGVNGKPYVGIWGEGISIKGNFVSISGETSSSYTINPITADLDGNQYNVLLTNNTGGCTVTSNTVTLTIAPEIIISTTTLPTINTTPGTPSDPVTFTIEGRYLTDDILVQVPLPFEVSKNDVDYGSSISFVPTDGVVTTQTVYVRTQATDEGTYNENVVCSSAGATTKNVAATAEVTPLPQISANTIAFTSSFYTTQGTPSSSQTFHLVCNYLIDDLIISALEGYEYSEDDVNYYPNLSITPVDGSLDQLIYVRLSGASQGSFTGNVTISSTNGPTRTVSANGNVVASSASVWNGSTWSTTPTASLDAIINGNYTGAGFTCNNLTINTGFTVTLNTDECIEVAGEITNNGNGLVLNNGAALVDPANTTPVSGLYKKTYTLDGNGWGFAATPVGTFTVQNVFNGDYVYWYDEAATTQNDAWINLAFGDNFEDGTGYLFNSGSGSKTFTGIFGLGTYTSGAQIPALQNNYQGFNLIGNPYAAYLDWDGTAKTNLDGNKTVWIWNGTTYDTHVQGDNYGIPPAASFFVQATGSSEVAFGDANKECTSSSKDSGFPELRLTASGNGLQDYVRVINPGDFEDFSVKMFTWNEEVPQIYIAGGEESYAIQRMDGIENGETIPVGFVCSQSGTYSLSTPLHGLGENVQVYLEDLVTGSFTELTGQNTYTFSHTAGDEPDRFVLHFATTITGAESITEAAVNIYSFAEKAYINTNGETAQSVEVYTLSGRLIYSDFNSFAGIRSFEVPATGVYIIKVQTENGATTERVVIN